MDFIDHVGFRRKRENRWAYFSVTRNIFGGSYSHLSGCFFPFGHKLWEGGRDLQMIFCLSVSAVWVVRIRWGGGDTWTLTAKSNSFELFAPQVSGDNKTLPSCAHPLLMPSHSLVLSHPSHIVRLSLPNISKYFYHETAFCTRQEIVTIYFWF